MHHLHRQEPWRGPYFELKVLPCDDVDGLGRDSGVQKDRY